jgi:hypothetical protein
MDHFANLNIDHAAAVVNDVRYFGRQAEKEAAVHDQDSTPDFGHIYAGDCLHLELDIAPYCLTDGHDIVVIVLAALFFGAGYCLCAVAAPSSSLLAFDEVAIAAALFALAAAAPRVSS